MNQQTETETLAEWTQFFDPSWVFHHLLSCARSFSSSQPGPPQNRSFPKARSVRPVTAPSLRTSLRTDAPRPALHPSARSVRCCEVAGLSKQSRADPGGFRALVRPDRFRRPTARSTTGSRTVFSRVVFSRGKTLLW